MQQDQRPLTERNLQNATAEEDDARTPPIEADSTTDDTQFSDEHPLASPGELAGTAGEAIAAEIAALRPEDGSLGDAAEDPEGDRDDSADESANYSERPGMA